MKTIIIIGLALLASLSLAADFTQYLAANYACSIPRDTLVTGSTGGFYGVYSDGSKFGTATFTWERWNVFNHTWTGYIVTTTVALPSSPNAAYYPNPATVTWLDVEEGNPGGGN